MNIGDDRPDMRSLYLNIVEQHAANWEALGALLGLQDYDIANIAKDHVDRATEACAEVLMMWLKKFPTPTWGKLDDAVQLIKEVTTGHLSTNVGDIKGKYIITILT